MEVDHGKLRAPDASFVHLEHALRFVLRKLAGLGCSLALGCFCGERTGVHSGACDSANAIQPLTAIDQLGPPDTLLSGFEGGGGNVDRLVFPVDRTVPHAAAEGG